MITSYDEQWAFDIQPVNSQFDYQDHLISYYELLRACGVSIDVISAHEKDISAYKLIIAPNLFLLNEDIADNLKEYVKKGGILVVTFFSGIKSWNGVVFDEPLPAKLRDLTDIELTEYDSLSPKQHREMELIHLEFPRTKGECTIWCDLIKCKQADIVGRYNDSYYQGEPCVTLNRFGKGYCMYIGTNPSPLIKKCLLKWVLNEAGIEMFSECDPQKLELVRNNCAGVNHLFLLNYSGKTESLELRRDYLELLHNRKYKAKSIIEVEPKGVRILREA